MIDQLKKRASQASLAVGLGTFSALSSAQLDTATTDAVAAASANVAQAGTLIIGVAAVAMGARWVKAMFF
ncbi:MAG: hypothetical protein AAF756_22165 [Pseudomonadota bacterium]